MGIKQPMYSKSEAVEATYKCSPIALDDLVPHLKADTFVPVVFIRDPDKSDEENDAAINEAQADAKKAFDAAQSAKLQRLISAEVASINFRFVEYGHRKNEAWLRDNIQSTLPASLLARGFAVEVLEHDDDLSLAGFKADSQSRKAVKRDVAKGLNHAVKADPVTAQRVQEFGSVNEQEYLEASRARAIEVMKVSDFDLDDAMIWGHGEGESKIIKFRELMSTTEALGATDERSSKRVMALLKPAFEVMTTGNTWTGTESVALFDSLNAIRNDVITTGIRISSAKSDQAKKADITKIFSQLGLVVKKHETTCKQFFYVITPKSLAQMTRYI